MKKGKVKAKAGAIIIAMLFFITTIVSTVNAYWVVTTPIMIQHQSTPMTPFFPSDLEEGDLLFMDAKPWIIEHIGVPYSDNEHHQSNDHVAIYIGIKNNQHMFIEANNYTIFGEQGNITLPGSSGVQENPWWVFCVWAENFTIGKVTHATEQQKQKAIDNAGGLLGYKYQSAYPKYQPYFRWSDPNITDPSNPYYHQTYYYPIDPYVDYYFCAELVWTCYLNCISPINLDPYPQSDGTYMSNPAWRVGPESLLESTNMTFIEVDVFHPQTQQY